MESQKGRAREDWGRASIQSGSDEGFQKKNGLSGMPKPIGAEEASKKYVRAPNLKQMKQRCSRTVETLA